MTRPLLPALLLLAGCATETGNPELDVQMSLTGQSGDERVAVDHVPATTLTGAWVVVDDVRLVEAEGCETVAEVEHTAEGPFAVDLLAADPFTVAIPADSTNYCRLRVRLDRADGEASLPAGMNDHAVYLEGERADHTPFVIRSREKFELDLRAADDAGAFGLDEGRQHLVLAFDLGTWIADLGLDDTNPGDDGVIRVDEDNEEDLLEAFEDRVESILTLHDDDDADGTVGDDDELLAN